MTSQEIMVETGEYKLSGRWRPAANPVSAGPLIVAIHGGSFTSRYFDLPGFSLLDRTHAVGLSALALDRPCYGRSEGLSPSDASFARNAEILSQTIQQFWDVRGAGLPGVVTIGHSIGAAISLIVASLPKRWPLLGLAISGVGLASPGHIADAWKSLPDIPALPLPPEVKRQVMFGPPWSYDASGPNTCMTDDFPTPRTELMEIVFEWPKIFPMVAPKVTVPVHYRLAEFDALWEVNAKTIDEVRKGLSASPLVDAAIYRNTGHCIDFHHVGAALQLHQIAFAMECAVRRPDEA